MKKRRDRTDQEDIYLRKDARAIGFTTRGGYRENPGRLTATIGEQLMGTFDQLDAKEAAK